MLLKLYQSSAQAPEDVPANKGYRNVANLLRLLSRRGIESETIDIVRLSPDDLLKAYNDAVAPSVRKKFGIRRVFGSRRRSGSFFGREVPALLVYEEEDRETPGDVYPQELGREASAPSNSFSTIFRPSCSSANAESRK
jgi:hypothetical protein